MSQYFPAPGKATTIQGPDGVALSGAVQLLPGNNQSISRAGQALTIVGASSKRARSLEIFSPGVQAARTLLIADNIPNAVLSGMDAYFRVAPGAGTDVNNYANLHVAGTASGGGPIDFPFNVLNQPEYHLGLDALSQLSGQDGSTGNDSSVNRAGICQQFTPTTNLTVGGIAFMASRAAVLAGEVGPFRVGIATAFNNGSGKTLATTPWANLSDGVTPAYVDVPVGAIIPGAGGVVFTTVAFPTTIALASGTQYVLVFQNQVNAAADVPVDTKLGGALTNMTLQNTIGTSGAGQAATWDTNVGFVSPVFKLLGAVLGTPISAPIAVSLTIVGAPANPGTDLVVSLQF